MQMNKGHESSRLTGHHETLFNKIFCAPKSMSRDEVQRDIHTYHPAGTTGGWILTHQADSPMDCDLDPTRQHWVCEC